MPVFEILKELELFGDCETYDSHVAYVDNEKQAIDFCEKHEECTYQPILITKYDNALEGRLLEVPCCENCLFCQNGNYCGVCDCDVEKNYICEEYTVRED